MEVIYGTGGKQQNYTIYEGQSTQSRNLLPFYDSNLVGDWLEYLLDNRVIHVYDPRPNGHLVFHINIRKPRTQWPPLPDIQMKALDIHLTQFLGTTANINGKIRTARAKTTTAANGRLWLSMKSRHLDIRWTNECSATAQRFHACEFLCYVKGIVEHSRHVVACKYLLSPLLFASIKGVWYKKFHATNAFH